MTSLVITDEMVKKAVEAFFQDFPNKLTSVGMRAALSAVAPMILEAAAKVPSEAASICLADAAKANEAGRDSCADRDRQAAHILRGIAAAIRALKEPRP
jgi:hypothetical protein